MYFCSRGRQWSSRSKLFVCDSFPPLYRRALVVFVNQTSFFSSSSSTTVSSHHPLSLHVETIGGSSVDENNNKNDNGRETAFLHGLLGHGRNLKTFAKKVCEVQHCTGHLIDLRGHGQSRLPAVLPSSSTATIPPSCSFDLCVQDITHTVATTTTTKQPISPNQWVGHSWGGRMALQYVFEQVVHTSKATSRKIDRLWLLDVVPGQANESVEHVVKTVAKLQAESYTGSTILGSKQELVERFTAREGLDMATAQWLASSYTAATTDFGFDLPVVQDILPEFGTQDFEGMLTTVLEQGDIRVDLVRGGKNKAWEVDGTWGRLERLARHYPQYFRLHVLPKAGHWVHIDDLQGLVSLFADSAAADANR